ncbi:MAG: hypothetical protein LUH14_08645 [Clostridiaceae bacterium]|nr:hypothetical protein [Clostridiaceae bacterium]
MHVENFYEKLEDQLKYGSKKHTMEGVAINLDSANDRSHCAGTFQDEDFSGLRTCFLFLETAQGTRYEWKVEDFRIQKCPLSLRIYFKDSSVIAGRIQYPDGQNDFFRFSDVEIYDEDSTDVVRIWGVIENCDHIVELDISTEKFHYIASRKEYPNENKQIPLLLSCVEADRLEKGDTSEYDR